VEEIVSDVISAQEYGKARLPDGQVPSAQDSSHTNGNKNDASASKGNGKHNSQEWHLDFNSVLSLLTNQSNPGGGTGVQVLPKIGIKVLNDAEGFHVSVPPAAVEVLKSFRPLLETLLKKTSSGSS